MHSINDFREIMADEGWIVFQDAVSEGLINDLTSDMENAYNHCRNIQINNGVHENTDGTVHHLVVLSNSFLQFLEACQVQEYLEVYFQGKYILNSFGGVKNIKNNLSYVGNIHRDIRSYSSDINLMINMLVMLDDFTEENGATYFYSGSHKSVQAPEKEEFYKNAKRAVGKKGSIILFNSNLWHAAGINQTDQERRALTLTFTKPFYKQQLDYCRAIGYEKVENFSENLKQILGYYSRVPSNLMEWYQPRNKRFYRSDQG